MVDREQTTGEELLRKEINRLNRMLRLFSKNTGELTDKQAKVIASMQKNYTAMGDIKKKPILSLRGKDIGGGLLSALMLSPFAWVDEDITSSFLSS